MSKSSANLYFLLPIFIMAILLTTQSPLISAKDPGKPTHYKYTVYIINGCESGIELPIHGQCYHVGNFSFIRLWEQYHWSFSVSYTRNVVYHCDISRGYTRTHQRQTITAFDLGRDSHETRCGSTGECYWKITEVGIYFGNNNSTWTRAYNWSSIAEDGDSSFIRPQQLPGNSLP